MDAHMRYFKQGYELLSQMEPFVHEVLVYSQQYKERTQIERDNLEKRIQAYRTNEELQNSKSSRSTDTPSNGDGIHIVGINPYKNIEALMQSTAKGEVQTIKQGYLFKRSCGLRVDWKKRFFVLDSRGALYYYRNKQGSQMQQSVGTSEHSGGVFGRFRFSHRSSSSQGEDSIGYQSIDLQTSTIKIDAEQSDLRFCFRIISPLKTHTLQAENASERAEWIDKITAVIASLLNSPFLKELDHQSSNADSLDYPCDSDLVHVSDVTSVTGQQNISEFLTSVPGNDTCAECSSPDPDWASLNLGILLCIECSGVHRNLGVHISKVRSLTLDVKVWEPTMLNLFSLLGNSYCNSIWEELLQGKEQRIDESNELTSTTKPGYRDAISIKEKFIQMKYAEKVFVAKEVAESGSSAASQIWEAVKANDVKVTYRLLIASDAGPNTTYDMVGSNNRFHTIDEQNVDGHDNAEKDYDPSNCPEVNDVDGPIECLQGCSLLHLACLVGEMVMLELLLQFGADINMQDFYGRSPLHHSVLRGKNAIAKYLIKRGACPSIKDYGGQTALERAMGLGPVTDEELFLLLAESE